MTVWIFNHYAQPNTRPGGTRHFDLARALIAQGYSVTIFAAGFHYTLLQEQYQYDRNGLYIEMIEGVRFVWVKTFPYTQNDWRRMLNILSFGWRVWRKISTLGIGTPDVIVGSTVHPFAALAASRIARRMEVPFVFEIRDLWPQTFIDMGLWKKDGWQSRIFYAVEAKTLKASKGYIVLSPLTIGYLTKHYGIDSGRMLLLPNGVSEHFLRTPKAHAGNPFSVTYVGGIDQVHGLDFLVDVAKALAGEPAIRFDVYGDGKDRKRLQARCKAVGLKNIVWHGPVSKSSVPECLEAADALFVSTSNVLYGSENKLYEYMAAARPLVVAAYGEHNNPARRVGCGISVDRSDPGAAADAIMALSHLCDADRQEMGQRGRRYVEQERMVPQLATRLANFLEQICLHFRRDESRL